MKKVLIVDNHNSDDNKKIFPMLILFTVVLVLFISVSILTEKPSEDIIDPAMLNNFDYSAHLAYLYPTSFEHYPGALYTPDDFAAGRVTEDASYDHTSTEQKHATYRLTLNLEPGRVYGLSGETATYAQTLWIDGEVYMAMGKPGTSAETMDPKAGYMTVYFMAQEQTEIVIQRSGYVHTNGGKLLPLYLGEQELITAMVRGMLLRVIFIVGIMVMSALFSFGIFLFFAEHRHFLWFAIACLVIAVRTLMVDNKVITFLLSDLSWNSLLRLEYILTMALNFFLILYIVHMFRWRLRHPVNLFGIGISVIYLPIILVTPTIFFTAVMPVVRVAMMFYLVSVIVWLVLSMIKNSVMRSIEHQLVLLGSSSYIFSAIIDMVLHAYRIDASNYVQLGMMLFVITNTMALLLELYRAERENEKLLQQRLKAEAASRSKSDFLTRMSHEIRTPMNAIIGITQMQLHEGNLSDEHKEGLEKIYIAGRTMLGIINDILDMSKIESGKLVLNLTEYDTSVFINDTVQLNIVRIGLRPIDFVLEIDENFPSKLYGDELRLKQILSNLLTNAFKYTEIGYVKLSIQHKLMESGNVMLCFIVEDTGQGMKPEETKELFSEYQRFNVDANRMIEGTGLGLSISKRLVELMDGTIEVQSEYGKGSIFTVTVKQKAMDCLPIGAKLAKQLSSFEFINSRQLSESQIVYYPMPYGNVLIVDDLKSNLYVAQGLLAPYKLKIETADSGMEAIEKVKQGKVYDVILMDHMMPKMDGIETVQNLRSMGYDGIIVALTANAMVGVDKMFMQKGFDEFIAKPIDSRHLNNLLNKFIRCRYLEEARKYEQEEALLEGQI